MMLMAIEKIRGCGYRKVGALYLVGNGISVPCDMLPLELEPCPTCGFEISFTRGFMWISKEYINFQGNEHRERDICKCGEDCPICFPILSNDLKKYGFMWVGQKYYAPETFIKESKELGVSKRIAEIPKGLELGKTWILLAHKKVDTSPELEPKGLKASEPQYKPAIFYAFRPTRIEKLIWKSQATRRKLNKLKKQGITPIIIPDGDKDHS